MHLVTLVTADHAHASVFTAALAFRASFFEVAKLRARRAMLSPPDSLVLLQKLCNSVLAKRMSSMELFHAVKGRAKTREIKVKKC